MWINKTWQKTTIKVIKFRKHIRMKIIFFEKKTSFGTVKIHCKEPETDKLQSLKVDTKIGSVGICHNFR